MKVNLSDCIVSFFYSFIFYLLESFFTDKLSTTYSTCFKKESTKKVGYTSDTEVKQRSFV